MPTTAIVTPPIGKPADESVTDPLMRPVCAPAAAVNAIVRSSEPSVAGVRRAKCATWSTGRTSRDTASPDPQRLNEVPELRTGTAGASGIARTYGIRKRVARPSLARPRRQKEEKDKEGRRAAEDWRVAEDSHALKRAMKESMSFSCVSQFPSAALRRAVLDLSVITCQVRATAEIPELLQKTMVPGAR